MKTTYHILFISLLLIFSCKSESKPRTYKLPKENLDNTLLDEVQPVLTEDIFWDKPYDWLEKDNDSFSLANYEIPFNDTYANLSITKFAGDAGGIVANVNRWRRQLGLEPMALKDIQSNALIGSSKIGDFFIYKIASNNKNEAFLCSILPIEGSTIFVKLKATVNIVNSLEKVFYEFCSSFRGTKL